MPNQTITIENIYDDVIVVLTDSKEYKIINTRNNSTINDIKIKDADMALAVKRAYCDGWYDAKHH